jgi:hypothetical protein
VLVNIKNTVPSLPRREGEISVNIGKYRMVWFFEEKYIKGEEKTGGNVQGK